MSVKRVKVVLDCGCDRWFTPGLIPDNADDIWCSKHERYERATASAVQGTTLVDDYWCTSLGRGRFSGDCAIDGCSYQESSVFGYWQLTHIMYTHHMREHVKSRFSPTFTVTERTRLPRNAPPPF